MKVFITGLLIMLAALPSSIFAQTSKGFEIAGHLDGLHEGEKVYLGNRFADWRKFVRTDSCLAIHGDFHLKCTDVPEGPRQYEIFFENVHRIFDKMAGKNVGGMWCDLFADNGEKIVIHGGNIDKMSNSEFSSEVIIEGSPSNFAKMSFLPVFDAFARCFQRIDNRMDEIRDSLGFDRPSVQTQIEAKSMLDDALGGVVSYLSAPCYRRGIPLFLACLDGIEGSHYHGSFLTSLYNSFDVHDRDSYYGRMVKDYARVSIGQPFPAFDLPTVDGKMVSSKDFVARNKVTLVHFWASNSYNRQKYQQELRVLYKKYNSKGLDIIGVSADSVASEWKTRVMVEQYPWPNVSDLKGNLKGSIVNDVYREGGHSVPNTTNVLLNAEGKIIAWDVNGVELQWYLWKYLGQ